jgi:hypothetical protein
VDFLLVHSPLVGPSTWRGVAERLRRAGHQVAVPDLRAAAESGDPDAIVTSAVAAGSAGPAALVGHSGAGFFLPLIAQRLAPRPVRTVFVDAGLPPSEGPGTASADFLDRLRSLAVDGRLPKWSQWWDDRVFAALVPDAGRRRELAEEMPSVPLELYEMTVELPPGWTEWPCAYLLLSESYRSDALAAKSLGWRVRDRLTGHLDFVSDPESTARDLLELCM